MRGELKVLGTFFLFYIPSKPSTALSTNTTRNSFNRLHELLVVYSTDVVAKHQGFFTCPAYLRIIDFESNDGG